MLIERFGYPTQAFIPKQAKASPVKENPAIESDGAASVKPKSETQPLAGYRMPKDEKHPMNALASSKLYSFPLTQSPEKR